MFPGLDRWGLVFYLLHHRAMNDPPPFTPPPRSDQLRKGRVSLPNRLYHVTMVTHHRRAWFLDLIAGRQVVRTLMAADQRQHCQTWTFVVMPDHVHWLLQLGFNLDLSRLVGLVKSRSSYFLKQVCGVEERIWQQGFRDRMIREGEDPRRLARYIVYNPVRAGIVAHPRAYSLWDARWL